MNETILVVDDEPKIIKLAKDYLEKGGFRVLTEGDGLRALKTARREHPDLIVLDLNAARNGRPGYLPHPSQGICCPHHYAHRPFRGS